MGENIDQNPRIARIVTRPDFDGIVCAVVLKAALSVEEPVFWTQPGQIQQNLVKISSGDVIANLPYHPQCGLWFDHHYSNKLDFDFKGAFDLAPSAARVIYEYFRPGLEKDFDELVSQADKIDAACLELDEILYPQKYPYILLSMTINGNDQSQQPYWDRLVRLLGSLSIQQVMQDQQVRRHSLEIIEVNKIYAEALQRHTTMQGPLSITDFRGISPAPDGNRFLVYSLFPEAVANIKIFRQQGQTVVKIGHSIVNRNCNVNVGRLLARYGGGGHKGAGACRFPTHLEDKYLPRIFEVMLANQVE